MYLYNIKLWNFRKYGSNEAFDLEKPNLNLNFKKGLNLLIGENDAGKTAIIDAIKIALKTSSYEWIRISNEDFYMNSDRLRIELKFVEFSSLEAKNFTEYLSWEKVPEIDNDKEIVTLNVIYDINRKDGKIVPTDVKAGSDQVGKSLNAEARDYLKVTYLKPLRDAHAEFIPKKNSRLSQIFQEHVAFKGKEDHVLLKLFREFNEDITNYFNGKDKSGSDISDQDGKALKNIIDNTIKSFFDERSKTSINTTSADMKKILESLELTLYEVVNPGLGSLNRLFMASELIHLNRSEWSGLRLGLIEELEAHLHPQVQLKIIEDLIKHENTQLITTTHSPNLASKVTLDKIIVCRNNNAYSLDSMYTCLDKKNYVFLEKFLDVTKANLFFAKSLILVEGWAEEILIPVIAKKIGCDLIKNEVSIINVGNLGFSNYYKIFSRKNGDDMNIPIAVITDSDVKAYEEIVENSIKKYSKIQDDTYKTNCQVRVLDITSNFVQPSTPFASPEWTFEWCLYKSPTFRDTFIEITKQIHSKTDWTNFELKLAEKLISQSLNKTEIAYKLAKYIEDENCTINFSEINNDMYINYIIEAIKHVCR